MEQVNPQFIIDELARRLQQATLENVVLSAQLAEHRNQEIVDDTTVIGEDITEEQRCQDRMLSRLTEQRLSLLTATSPLESLHFRLRPQEKA